MLRGDRPRVGKPLRGVEFQRAPTLGGECYQLEQDGAAYDEARRKFQWAPTLGGECYVKLEGQELTVRWGTPFQWAPTLGGECYQRRYRNFG